MSNVEIFYYPVFNFNWMDEGMLHHPLSMEDVYLQPEKVSEIEEHKQYEYYQCPAWKNWAQRTFLYRMQYDIDVTVNNQDFDWVSSKPEMVLTTEGWCHGNEPLIQVANAICMWTHSKDVIFECIPYPRTTINNNMEVVSAHFPVSAWERTTSLGFRVVDHNETVSLKRGDPIHYLRFHTKSFRDTVTMTKKFPPDDVIYKINQHLTLKNFGKNLSWKTILNRQEKQEKSSKCPFSFLFDKS